MSLIQRGQRGQPQICVSDSLEKARNVKWAVLNTGSMNVWKSDLLILRGQSERKKNCPIWCSYIETPDVRMLIDTGQNPNAKSLQNSFSRSEVCWNIDDIVQSPDQCLDKQLEKLGVLPDEIDIVLYSHLHTDHTGFSTLFPKARHIAQLAELRYALAPDNWQDAIYCRGLFLPVLDQFDPINGDVMIAPGIYALEAPGHTPGSQVILIMPEKGQPWFLLHDIAYLMESFKDDWPPSMVYDPIEFIRSLQQVKQHIRTLGAKYYFGHDAEQFRTMKTAPEWEYNDY
ncbi:N-acyl homoserine lactonase family protein [Chloroflexota bacterium]